MVVVVILLMIAGGFVYEVTKYSGMKEECAQIFSSNESARIVTIYFKPTPADYDAQVFVEKIRPIEGVKDVKYISSAQALEEFKEKQKNDPTILQSLNELKVNPLLASVSVEFETITQAADNTKDALFQNAAVASRVSIERIPRGAVETIAKQLDRIDGISPLVGITSIWDEQDTANKDFLRYCLQLSAK